MHFPIYRKRPSFDWLCTPLLCPTTGFGVTTDCSKHPEKPSLSVVGCSGGDGFCDLAGGLYAVDRRGARSAGDQAWRRGENAWACRAALGLEKFARADHHDI